MIENAQVLVIYTILSVTEKVSAYKNVIRLFNELKQMKHLIG